MLRRLKSYLRTLRRRNSTEDYSSPQIMEIDWLFPWHPGSKATPADGLAKELYSELCPDHVLYGIPVVQIGFRQDCDDALFRLLDGTDRLAVVHLTFSRHPEPDPKWPETRIYDDAAQFVREEMIPAVKELGC